jgi:hypothetical protein
MGLKRVAWSTLPNSAAQFLRSSPGAEAVKDARELGGGDGAGVVGVEDPKGEPQALLGGGYAPAAGMIGTTSADRGATPPSERDAKVQKARSTVGETTVDEDVLVGREHRPR